MIAKSKLTYLFLFLFLFGFVVAFAYLAYFSEANHNDKEGKEKVVSYEYKDCRLLVGSFENLKSGYTSEELDDLEIKINEDHPYEIISEDQNALIYISPVDTDPRLKNFKVDGVSFWDIENIEEYPLCDTKIAEDIQDLYEYDGKYYTFDFNAVSSIYSAGETIPVRAVDRTWLDQTDNYSLLYDRYADIIKDSDLSLIMLENPVKGDPEPCRGCMSFVADEKNVSVLKELGFDAVGIGNHFGDGGKSALERTIQVFAENKLPLAGVSVTGAAESSKPQYLDMNGRKVAFLSADDVAAYYWAGEAATSWGTNRYSSKSSSGGIGPVDKAKIEKDINAAKENADLVVVMVSWGVEYTNKASTHQVEMAHNLIDAGVDIIIGSHPHWVQQVEFYNNKPIFYSLGNYVFDQTNDGADADWSRSKGQTRQGISVQMHFVGTELKAIDIIPHKMCGYDQAPGGESANKTHNLAWKIQSGEMSYAEADRLSESEGCVWYQPTPLEDEDAFYKGIWERLLEYSSI